MNTTNMTTNGPGHTSGHQGKILVVDDDLRLRDLLRRYLAEQGFNVVTAENAQAMNKLWIRERYDLLVLDLMLPGEDGLSLCRDLRARGEDHIPVLMLTARGDEADRVLGLEMGADDYLAKPFATRELLARIRAVLRRTRMLPPNLRQAPGAKELAFGDWRLDTTARHLLDAQGTVVPLTGGEYRLLMVLIEHPQRVLTRDQLLNLTQGRDADPLDRSIDLLISRLRRRLRDESREPRYIKTVRSEGYVFCTDVDARGQAA